MISKVKLALWLGFFLRLGNAFSNGFYGPSYGASDDSLGCHLNAVQYSQNLVFDVFLLGNIYSYSYVSYKHLTLPTMCVV